MNPFNNIPTIRSTHRTRNNVRYTFFRNTYVPFTVTEWNKLDKSVRNAESSSIFKKSILKFMWPSGNSIFNFHNPKGIKIFPRLRLGLSHLRGHKFNRSFPRLVKSYLQLCNWYWTNCSLPPSLSCKRFS